jgi:hypothetical protein
MVSPDVLIKDRRHKAKNETKGSVVLMTSTYRTMLAAIVAALAFSAVTVSAASAHEFHIAGSPLTETKTATGTGSTADMVWHILKAEVRIECKSTKVTDDLKTAGKLAGEITFENCKTPEYTGCSVPNVKYDFEGNLAGTKGELTDEVLPEKGGSTLFEFVIKTAAEKTCALKGLYPVDGHYACGLPGVETEALEHEVACKPEESSLTVNNETFTMSYSQKLKLSTGQDWSAS